MNEKIVDFLREKIESSGIKYTYIAKEAKIDYQRLMRIFNQNAVIRGSELICICKVIGINQGSLMQLLT